MVRGALICALALATGCRENREMSDRVEMPAMDSSIVRDPMKLDSLLDTMPGGEMVRGNDSAAVRLIKKKM
ncbi:MAG: hypothetical protein ACREL9_03915 [Gemmatimonadales bacterium]